jgi:hypothetical protein
LAREVAGFGPASVRDREGYANRPLGCVVVKTVVRELDAANRCLDVLVAVELCAIERHSK